MKLLLTIFSCLLFIPSYSQEFKIMYYNILWYEQDVKRDLEYLKIFEETNPDIIVAIELSDKSDDNQFFRNVIKQYDDDFRKGRFHPSNNGRTGCDINIYYNKDKFTLLSQDFISADPRDFALYELGIADSEEILYVIGAHLKASKGGEHAIRRRKACEVLVDYLEASDLDSNVIFGGDFNFYSSTESAYQLLVNEGDFFDPLGEGKWHDNEEFKEIHTQSTRVRGVGSTGGLDDRFDFIMFSEDLLEDDNKLKYVLGSYSDFGNDGGDFNQAINQGNNSEVSKEIANALFNASDHLPVMIKISID